MENGQPTEQEVYKTTVEISVGISIEVAGSWEKTNVRIESEIGPGYPSAETMQKVGNKQMQDATMLCNEQIELIARKTLEKARKEQGMM